MAKFKCTAESIGYLETMIEAENEEEASIKFEEMLDNGEVPEVGLGSIENKEIVKA